MTEKLYYQDSHLTAFRAKILRFEELAGGRIAVVLDRTAFFPEGGGQHADTGRIGEMRVEDVREKNGEILHILAFGTEAECAVGTEVSCELDREVRFRRMQNHSGEHIVSGFIHGLYGYENVGFHMGRDAMTIDFSGPLTWEQCLEVETRANAVVRDNLPVRPFFPSPEELAALEYRSKKELTGEVRIVEIPGVDRCACCAPHVKQTGEVGIIKFLSCEKHKNGVRTELVCGLDALDVFNLFQRNVTGISNLLSAERGAVSEAVEHLIAERDALKYRQVALEREAIAAIAERIPETPGNLVLFRDPDLNEASRRELVNLLTDRCGGLTGVFAGSDEAGYQYIIGSRHLDLRRGAKEINAAILGRGGGRPEMIMGSCRASEEEIRRYFSLQLSY